MEILSYRELIKNIPYLEQSFTSKKYIWENEKYTRFCSFKLFIDDITTRNDNIISFTRQKLFDICAKNPENGLFATIIWGYPGGMRGNNFEEILEVKENILRKLPVPGSEINRKELRDRNIFNNSSLKGLGPSTITKLLYTFQITIESNRCLILDKKLLNIFNEGKFQELSNLKEIRKGDENDYLKYLEKIKELAGQLNTKEDKIELFLWMFGKNLDDNNNNSL